MSLAMIFHDRKFFPLMWTQFFGALNDNILKNALVVLLAFKGIELWGIQSELLVTFITLIFILPFFIFSELAGQIADKFEKSQLVRIIKTIEIFMMAFAGIGFYFEDFPILIFSILLIGIHSTFFGPIKYSALPDLLPVERLTSGTAYVEMGTFIAILIGTLGGGFLISLKHGEIYVICFLMINSIVGLYFGNKISQMPIGNSSLKINLHPWRPLLTTVRFVKKNRTVYNSILGISWFWFLGAIILSILPTLAIKVLQANELVITAFLATFTIGIALGAFICERISFGRVEIGVVPLGSLGMSLFLGDWARVLWQGNGSSLGPNLFIDLLGIAIFGGIFTVPLYTLISQRTDREHRSRTIGANNIINSLFMVIGSALLMLFFYLNFSLPLILAIFAILNLLVSFYIYSIVPEFTLRFLMWMVARICYHLKISGATHIPKEGAAILVSNHVSFIDWLIIGGAIKRPIRFVMYYRFARTPLLRFIMRQGGVISIAGKSENEKIFDSAFEKISHALQNGELVCIFPEGSITRTGEIQEFKRGLEFVLMKNSVPVIPIALKGLWGTFFSPDQKKIMIKIFKIFTFFPQVHLNIGEQILPANATAAHLEKLVRALAKS